MGKTIGNNISKYIDLPLDLNIDALKLVFHIRQFRDSKEVLIGKDGGNG